MFQGCRGRRTVAGENACSTNQARERIEPDPWQICFAIGWLAYPAARAARAGIEEELLWPWWALDIRKSNSTGSPGAANHCVPERLNSMASGKPAEATRMRFLL
jgi:hypothetical protein